MHYRLLRPSFLFLLLSLSFLVLFPSNGPLAAQQKPFTVYLGFDDGPTVEITGKILDVLKAYNVKATFFIQGSKIHGREQMLQREIREGHHIGNHLVSHELNIMSNNHPNPDLLIAKYNETEGAINAALGPELSAVYNAEEPVKPFRWPGGATQPFPLPVVTYNWNATTGDMRPGGVTPQQALRNVLYGYPPIHFYGIYAWGDGAVVLLHDTSRSTAAALPYIIKNLQAYGVQFGTLPRPGDQPGMMPISLDAVPPCSHKPGNCGPQNNTYPLEYAN